MAYHEDRFGLGHSSAIRSPLIGSAKGMGVTSGYRCRIVLFSVKADTLGACPQPSIAPYDYVRDDGTRARYAGRAAIPGKTGSLSISTLGTFDGEATSEAVAQAQAQDKLKAALPAAAAPGTSYFAIYARTVRKTVDVYGVRRNLGSWNVGGANFTRRTQGLFCVSQQQGQGTALGWVTGSILTHLPALGIDCFQTGITDDKAAQIAFSVLGANFTLPAQNALVWANGVAPSGTPASIDPSLPDWLNPFSPNFGNPSAGGGSGSGGGPSVGGGSGPSVGGGTGTGTDTDTSSGGGGGGSGAIVGLLGIGALAYLLTKG